MLTKLLFIIITSLVGCKIHARRSQHILWIPQHFRSHYYVHILHDGCNWTGNAKISLVEEILDNFTDGTIYWNHGACLPAIL